MTKSFIRTSPVIVPASLLNECFFFGVWEGTIGKIQPERLHHVSYSGWKEMCETGSKKQKEKSYLFPKWISVNIWNYRQRNKTTEKSVYFVLAINSKMQIRKLWKGNHEWCVNQNLDRDGNGSFDDATYLNPKTDCTDLGFIYIFVLIFSRKIPVDYLKICHYHFLLHHFQFTHHQWSWKTSFNINKSFEYTNPTFAWRLVNTSKTQSA